MTEIDLTGIPVLPAYDTSYQYHVWCMWCRRWHFHSRGEGHRVAHCDKVTPYTATGYILKLAGNMTPAIKRAKGR